MTPPHGNVIDPQLVLAVLGDFPDSVCTPLTGGLDAMIWRVETTGARYALRLLGANQRSQATRELAASRWAHAHGLPVPGIVASGFWQDRPAYLMEWAEGQTLAATLLNSSSGMEAAPRLGQEFGIIQARIHLLTPPTDPSIVDRDWRTWEQLDAELASRLERFPNVSTALLHLDYHPLNVLTAADGISAVLDWANVHIGDPRIDLARTLAILQLAPLPDPTAIDILRTFEAGWREGYAMTAGAFDIPPLLRWWAGAAMEQDLAPKVSTRSAPWLNEAYLTRIRRWTNAARQESLQDGSQPS